MKLVFLAVIGIIALSQAATTRKPHEPNEFEQLFFFYNRVTHNLLLKESGRTYVNCYVSSLSDMQMAHVHSDKGLKSLELYMLSHMSGASQVSMGMLAEEDTRWCNHGINMLSKIAEASPLSMDLLADGVTSLNMLSRMSGASQVSMGMLADEDTNWCNHGIHNRTVVYYSL